MPRAISFETSTLDHLYFLFNQIGTKLIAMTEDNQEKIPYLVNCVCDKSLFSLKYWYDAFVIGEERIYLINAGIEVADKFFNEIIKQSNLNQNNCKIVKLENNEEDKVENNEENNVENNEENKKENNEENNEGNLVL